MTDHAKLEDAIHAVESRAWYLLNLSEAFLDTGNSTMAEKLKFVSDDLRFATNEIREEVNRMVCENFDASVQSSTNVLNAALAGIEYAKRS
jgi:hypothetical protein